MAEWTDPLIRTLIDERRTRNEEIGKDSGVLSQVRSIKRMGHHSAVTNVKKNSRISSGIIMYVITIFENFVVSSTNYPSCPVRLCVILCLVKVKPEVEQVHDILMNFVLTFGRDLRMNSIESAELTLLTKNEVEEVDILRPYHQLGISNVN